MVSESGRVQNASEGDILELILTVEKECILQARKCEQGPARRGGTPFEELHGGSPTWRGGCSKEAMPGTRQSMMWINVVESKSEDVAIIDLVRDDNGKDKAF